MTPLPLVGDLLLLGDDVIEVPGHARRPPTRLLRDALQPILALPPKIKTRPALLLGAFEQFLPTRGVVDLQQDAHVAPGQWLAAWQEDGTEAFEVLRGVRLDEAQ